MRTSFERTIGIGCDLVEVERIRKAVTRFGDRFLKRIFTEEELSYSLSKVNSFEHLAARFAAKEAVYKAVSSYTEEKVSWLDISVKNDQKGRPSVKLEFHPDIRVELSLSHTKSLAQAVAVAYLC